MKSIQLLSARKWLLALALRENVEAMRLARMSSGFGGISFSCDYYIDGVARAKSNARHYFALAKLGAVALQRLDGESRAILERKYLRGDSCEAIADDLGIKLRSFYRKKENAVAAFESQVRKILEQRHRERKVSNGGMR